MTHINEPNINIESQSITQQVKENKKSIRRLISNNKKIIAREILLIVLWLGLSFVWNTINEIHNNTFYQYQSESVALEDQLKVSDMHYANEIFNYLESNHDYLTNEHTFKSFYNLFDTSENYRNRIYAHISDYDVKYKNKNTYQEFLARMNTKTIMYKGEILNEKEALALINALAKRDEQFPFGYGGDDIIVILFILFFPFRFLFYTIRWCFKELRS